MALAALLLLAACAHASPATCTPAVNYTCNNPAAKCSCMSMPGCNTCVQEYSAKIRSYCQQSGDFKEACTAITGGSPGPAPGPSTDDDEGSPDDPKAKCITATPSTPQCCYANTTAPVLGGIDMVDLASKVQGSGVPSFGLPEHSATLNDFTFWFLTADNAAIFQADPWSYAPAWGGF